VGQAVAAYADRVWPADESARPPEALRTAIERSLRPLHRQPGAHKALAAALQGDDPAQRLAAGELILAMEWQEPALIAPLLAAARNHAEPVAVIREALWRHVRDDPGALTGRDLPLRQLLARELAVGELTQRPVWLAIMQGLYLRLDWTAGQPLNAAAICFDSPLTPWLLRALRNSWAEEQLLDQLMILAGQDGDPVLARDAAWALAVADDGRWQRLLRASGDVTVLRCTIAGLAWNAVGRDLDIARALVSDIVFDLALARACASKGDRNLTLDLARIRTRVRDRDLARDLDLDLKLVRDLDRALARNFDRARDSALNLGYDLARSRVGDHACDRNRVLAFVRELDRDVACRRNLYSTRYLFSTLDLDFALDFALDCIEGDINAVRTRIAKRPDAIEILAALNSAINRVRALRTVLQVWRALNSALSMSALLDSAAGQGAGRIMWSADQLGRAAERSPDLLARLRISSPSAQTTKHRGTLFHQIHRPALEWLISRGGLFRRHEHATLPMAELDEITAASLQSLLPKLVDADDLLRHRARAVLLQQRLASSYGQEALLVLAQQLEIDREASPTDAEHAADGALLVETYCSWTLNHVLHDRPDWLVAWVAELDAASSAPLTNLLSHIHQLSEPCWYAFLDLLSTSGTRSQEALLVSTSWLLRFDLVREYRAALSDVLLALTQSTQEEVGQYAAFALGCFRNPPPRMVQALFSMAQGEPVDGRQLSMANALAALARLAPRLYDRSAVDWLLAAAPASSEVDAALARWLVNWQYSDAQTLVRELTALRPDAAAQLQALLAAGADNDVWDSGYHDRIAGAVRLLLMQNEALWPLLVEELRSALAAESWERHRIVLASLARCAEAMPQQFNCSAADLAPLLLHATQNKGSFSSRRFAITCLSYLRVITSEVLAALLRLAGDIEVVRDDALAAATRFNRLDPSLGEALPHELTTALTGPSVLRARTAARLLHALGTSQVAQATPGLRRQIVQALAAALQEPGSRRLVWISADETDGTLDQDLYQTLLRVYGF
jgi:hypothetical protein